MGEEVRNLNQKLVGALSEDRRAFEIRLKDCVTQLKVMENGTLYITHRKKAEILPAPALTKTK